MKITDLILTPQTYMGDTAFFFTIDTNYTGYTRDKILWHVLNKGLNKYDSYDESLGEFSRWLQNYNSGIKDVTQYQIYNKNNGGLEIDTSSISWVPVAIGGAVILILLMLK